MKTLRQYSKLRGEGCKETHEVEQKYRGQFSKLRREGYSRVEEVRIWYEGCARSWPGHQEECWSRRPTEVPRWRVGFTIFSLAFSRPSSLWSKSQSCSSGKRCIGQNTRPAHTKHKHTCTGTLLKTFSNNRQNTRPVHINTHACTVMLLEMFSNNRPFGRTLDSCTQT